MMWRNPNPNRLIRCAAAIAFLFFGAAAAPAAKVNLEVATANSVLLADKKQTTYLKVGLRALAEDIGKSRPLINAAIVLDKSGSMNGEKIERAKEAAQTYINGLHSNDIVSVITYDTNVCVLVPATKVSDKDQIFAAINRIRADGGTALFAGVSKGAAEVRKFLGKERVNRVVLLSDGLANVGPSSPADLAALGRSLAKDGIAVTTIGLGLDYNEDLMTQLADASDGNHAFVENSADLARIFENELGAATQIVAQDVTIEIRLAPGITIKRMLGREGTVSSKKVTIKTNQLYNDNENYVVLEIEVPEGADGTTREIASASVRAFDMETKSKRSVDASASVTFSNKPDVVEESTNKSVMVPAVTLVAVEENRLATQLRDEGKVEEARERLLRNSEYLARKNDSLKDEGLDQLSELNKSNAANLSPAEYQKEKKIMRESQSLEMRQAYKLKK